jgi:hypothetical protein
MATANLHPRSRDAKRSALRVASLLKGFILFTLVVLSSAWADADDEIPQPPAIGRPDDFDPDEGPIGSFEIPSVQADKTTLQVDDSLTLRVRISVARDKDGKALARVWRPPSLPKLKEFTDFKDQFRIEYVGDPNGRRVDERTWEFTYTLKPKSTDVKAVPSFPFVFFTPGFVPPEKGYQVKRSPCIDVTVLPRAAVQPVDVKTDQPPARAPDAIYQLAEGPHVLSRPSAWPVERLLAVAVIGLIMPPGLCVVWCLVWRRLNPDAARRAKQRRSQAARQALRALRAASKAPRGDLAQGTASIVAAYLRQRFDFAAAEPTPAEVDVHLARTGIAPRLIGETSEFFRTCDAARFAPASESRPEVLHRVATQLINSLEAESWPVSNS